MILNPIYDQCSSWIDMKSDGRLVTQRSNELGTTCCYQPLRSTIHWTGYPCDEEMLSVHLLIGSSILDIWRRIAESQV